MLAKEKTNRSLGESREPERVNRPLTKEQRQYSGEHYTLLEGNIGENLGDHELCNDFLDIATKV